VLVGYVLAMAIHIDSQALQTPTKSVYVFAELRQILPKVRHILIQGGYCHVMLREPPEHGSKLLPNINEPPHIG